MRGRPNQLLLLVFLPMIALIGSRFLPFLWPDARLWGFNHLLFLSQGTVFGFLAIGLITLLCYFSPLNNIANRLYDGISRPWVDARRSFWLAIAGAFLVIFWFCRMPTNLLGDGYSVVNNIGGTMPTIFKWSEALAVKIIFLVSRLLPYEGLKRGEYAYAIVSVLSGGATIYFFLGLSHELAADAGKRLFIFGSLLFSGWVVLFLGYAENYPILWPFVIGYLYFGIRFISGKSNLFPAIVCLIVALALHLQTLFFALSLPILLISRESGARFYRRYAKIIWPVIGLMAVSAGTVFIHRYNRELDFRINFLPPFQGRPATPGYAIFSVNHLIDILNEFTLLFPLWPLLLILGWTRLRDLFHDPVDRFLSAFGLGGLILILMVDPRLGMGRDWDLMALVGMGPALILLRAVLGTEIVSQKSFPAILGLSILLSGPFVMTELARQPSLNYMQWLLRLDLPRSKSGMVVLRNYYNDQGDVRRADSVNHEMYLNFAAARLLEKIETLVKSGQIAQAQILADSIYNADPYNVDAYSVQGSIAFAKRDYVSALAYFEQAHRIQPENYKVLTNLGKTYQHLGRQNDLLATLRLAQQYAPDEVDVLFGLAAYYYTNRQFDSSYVYALRTMSADSMYADAHYLAGLSALALRQPIDAKRYLSRYLQINPKGPGRESAEKLLQSLP